MSLETASCPECGQVAEVTRREWLASTAGPVEHVHIRCVQRHWFLLPAASVVGLVPSPSSTSREHSRRVRGPASPS